MSSITTYIARGSLAATLLAIATPVSAQFYNSNQRPNPAGILGPTVGHGVRGAAGSGVLAIANTGDTFQFDYTVGDWVQISTAAQPGVIGATCVTRGSIAFALAPGGTAFEWDDTANQWVNAGITNNPNANLSLTMAPMPNGDIIAFGGANAAGLLNETWVLPAGATAWTQLTPPVSPRARQLHGMATTATGILMFGGVTSSGANNETWAFDGTTWSPLSPATVPSARFAAGMSSWVEQNTAVVFGGIDQAGATQNDCFVFRNGNWLPVPGTFNLSVYGSVGRDQNSDEVLATDSATTFVSQNGWDLFQSGCPCAGVASNMDLLMVSAAANIVLGGAFTMTARDYTPGEPLFLLGSNNDVMPPVQFPGLNPGCLSFLPTLDLTLLLSIAPPPSGITGFPAPPIPIPNTLSLVGQRFSFQVVQFNFTVDSNCSSNALRVRIGDS